jgi:hypothetical protein
VQDILHRTVLWKIQLHTASAHPGHRRPVRPRKNQDLNVEVPILVPARPFGLAAGPEVWVVPSTRYSLGPLRIPERASCSIDGAFASVST